MLDSLLDFQFAYDFLKQGESTAAINNTRDPVDIHYEKLKCDMEVFKLNYLYCLLFSMFNPVRMSSTLFVHILKILMVKHTPFLWTLSM